MATSFLGCDLVGLRESQTRHDWLLRVHCTILLVFFGSCRGAKGGGGGTAHIANFVYRSGDTYTLSLGPLSCSTGICRV